MKYLITLIIFLGMFGCSQRCSICDDTYRIESLNGLINDFTRLKYRTKDSSKIALYDYFIWQLKSNRLRLIQRCLKEKGAKIYESIDVTEP